MIEETINLLLTRARSEAEIATMATHTHRLSNLSSAITAASAAPDANGPVVTCTVQDLHPPGPAITLTKLAYSRGSARVRVSANRLRLDAGRTYAVTGPNGSGKSTLFSIIGACSRSPAPGKPHHPVLGQNIKIAGRGGEVALQTADVVELTQRFFCPLHIRPIDWILQPFETLAPELRPTADRVLELFGELQVFGDSSVTADDLARERADWFKELSGGQQSKIEFARKIFLRRSCPRVLLIDEALGPLDAGAKGNIQAKLKAFCRHSLLLVIHHAEAGAITRCVAPGFYDGEIRLESGLLTEHPVCTSSGHRPPQ